MRVIEPTEEELIAYRQWVDTRPLAVRILAQRFDPWSLYRFKPSGHRVTVLSFDERIDGTVTLTVLVSGQYNAVLFERNVFGVRPDDLESADVPHPDERTGAVLTHEQVAHNIETLRVYARPDLWVMDETTGKAMRKQ